MKLFVCLLAGAALAQNSDLSSLSSDGNEDFFSYYYDEYGMIPSNSTEERGKKPLIRDDPGSCLTCNVEGFDYSAALNECRKKGKFVQCNRDSGSSQQVNICELTERRNNGKVYLNAVCNQKQACLGNKAFNKQQCLPFGATDRKFINPCG